MNHNQHHNINQNLNNKTNINNTNLPRNYDSNMNQIKQINTKPLGEKSKIIGKEDNKSNLNQLSNTAKKSNNFNINNNTQNSYLNQNMSCTFKKK